MFSHKGYVYRLKPSAEQETLLSQHFGHVRFVKNLMPWLELWEWPVKRGLIDVNLVTFPCVVWVWRWHYVNQS